MMRIKPGQHPSSVPVTPKAVVYARVSSKEQEKEGYSIPAQQKLLRDYATKMGFAVIQEFIDIETAKATGRTGFTEMLGFFKKESARPDGQGCNILLVEKTDRLYRNLKDWVTVDEFDLHIHLVKENEILSRDSRSHQKLIHGIKVLMAKNYIDNLGEEAKKGMMEKAAQGIFPTKAPLGYVNVTLTSGKKVIEKEPKYNPLVRKLFEWFATGQYSLLTLAKKAHEEGLRYRRTGQKVPKSHIHSVLRNPVYYGDFIWQGKLFKGSHESTVSKELWDQVQAILDDRSRPRRKVHSFAFQGLITCGHCGSQYTAELKKGRYVYYHCSQSKGHCPEKYVPEAELERQLGEALAAIRMDDEVLQWVLKALRESHKDKTEYRDSAVALLEDQQRKLRNRLDAMYLDKLDGKISVQFFEQKSEEWRRELEEIERKRAAHFAADDSYIEEGAKLIELVQRAVTLYEKQDSHEKRRLLNFVLSNSIWRDGKLAPNYRKPFDSLVLANAETKKAQYVLGTEPGKNEIWLGNLETNVPVRKC